MDNINENNKDSVSAESECPVQIAVRERPPFTDESETITELDLNTIFVKDKQFAFDYVFDADVSQKSLYDQLIKPMLTKIFDGFFCTVLAYGQTGTGKSYCMGLHNINNVNLDKDENFIEETSGIIPRVLVDIFASVHFQESVEPKNSVKISFIEIYNERVYDLLSENTSDQINTKGCSKFSGSVKCEVKNFLDAQKLLKNGNQNRHVRPTKMNVNSSRSHAVFTIYTQIQSDTKSTMSALHLVDLAGSESVRRTGNQGAALTEGVNINQGLLSIGKVLQALSSGSKVIPYRDSVLTTVLQDSLNLNSYLTLLACISPLKDDVCETLSTLRFAHKGKFLPNTPQVNNFNSEQKKRTPKKLFVTPGAPPLRTKQQSLITPRRPVPLMTSTAILGSSAKRQPHLQSNTFCTPNKTRKVDYLRNNQSEIIFSPSSVNAQQRKRGEISKFSMIQPRESTFSISSSFLNISSSTSVDIPSMLQSHNMPTLQVQHQEQTLQQSFSPFVRRIEQLELTIQQRLEKFVETFQSQMLHSEVTVNENSKTKLHQTLPIQTPTKNSSTSNKTTTQLNQNCSITNETNYENDLTTECTVIQRPNIVHSNNISNNDSNKSSENNEIAEDNVTPPVENDQTSHNSTIALLKKELASLRSEISMLTTNIKDSVDKDLHEPVIDTNSVTVSHESDTNDFKIPSNTTKHIERRRSNRLMLKNRHTLAATSNYRKSNNEKKIEDLSRILPERIGNRSKSKMTSQTLLNELTAGGIDKKSKQISKSKHRESILKLLNMGNLKQLQILPQIGMKTAYQIITHRSLNGQFKDFRTLAKLPIWRGKAWNRFETANNLQ